MSVEKLLKDFIKESIDLEDMKKDSPYLSSLGDHAVFEPNLSYSLYPHGTGVDLEDVSQTDIDYIKDFVMQVTGDAGVITSHPRVNEDTLRSFIREAVKNEKKK